MKLTPAQRRLLEEIARKGRMYCSKKYRPANAMVEYRLAERTCTDCLVLTDAGRAVVEKLRREKQ